MGRLGGLALESLCKVKARSLATAALMTMNREEPGDFSGGKYEVSSRIRMDTRAEWLRHYSSCAGGPTSSE